jgi:hypothetical protein
MRLRDEAPWNGCCRTKAYHGFSVDNPCESAIFTRNRNEDKAKRREADNTVYGTALLPEHDSIVLVDVDRW